MRVRFYQVECGDAASIMFKDEDGNPRFIFIDSGYERTFREILAGEINEILKINSQIDLWVITHNHDDHIGGAISYIKAIQKKEAEDIVSEWWYNHPYQNIEEIEKSMSNFVSEVKSFAQGEKLSEYLKRYANFWLHNIVSSSPIKEIHGLKLNILSPTATELLSLRKSYTGQYPNTSDYQFHNKISEPMGAVVNDYLNTIDSFCEDDLDEDNSIENKSCITFLSNFEGKKILWLSDAVPSLIITSLNEMGYSEDNPIEVDLVKVPHHGSKVNNSSELFSIIRCSKYLFSASGDNKYCLPTKACIATILHNKKRPKDIKYELIFTHNTASISQIFTSDGVGVFEKWNFKVTLPETNSWIDIFL